MGVISRRTLLKLLGTGAATVGAGCAPAAPPETPRQAVARMLALEGPESVWIGTLDDRSLSDLRDALSGAARPASRASMQFLARMLDHRSRLFVYVHYPAVADRRSVCDGLLRE